nr:uncharacterized protein LOC120976102 [Aegilops tauschii subsp. strangulata]
MPYDEWYTPYIKQAGLLPWIQLVSRSTPNLNAPLVSALADRWRPETHSFHLQTGEMTATLEDVSLITGLAIDGMPLCMSTDSDGWREQMIALIGMAPTEAEADVEEGEEPKKKERKAAGAAFTWIQANFAHCPADATDDVIQTHARVYMWHVVSRTLFPDSTGKNAPWMWLKALTVFDSKWSWGSATLAYLYRQLDDACCRITDRAGIDGNMLLLSVWSWERLPVGLPKSVRFNPWYEDEDDDLRRPTWAYKWDVVSEMTNDVNLMYQKYIAELDTITPEQGKYNRDVEVGQGVPAVPRAEIKKAADERASLFWRTHRLEKAMMMVHYEHSSRSGTPSDPSSHHQGDDVSSSYAYLDDEGAVTQEGHDIDGDMTLADAQLRSPYVFKPRQPRRRYTPNDFDNRGNPKVVVGTSRMASLDHEAEAEVQEEEARPPGKKKIACRHGTRNTRGKH